MTSEPVRVTAVLVTYRSEATVGRALEALRPGADSGFLRAIVIDNDSPDSTGERVERDHPWATLLRSSENLGYGRGCNLGFEKADTPYVLFMNPDAELPSEALRRLVAFMDAHPQAGMSAPATRLWTGGYQHAGGVLTPGRVVSRAAGFYGDRRQWELVPGGAPRETDWLCGAILLVRSDAFRQVGGFDPRFFLYFEETDLCLRLRKAKWELWGVGEAEAAHSAGSSMRSVNPDLKGGEYLPEHYFPSRYYYLAKHYGRFRAFFAEATEVALKAVRDLARLVCFRPRRRELRTRLQGSVFTAPPKTD